MKSPVVVPKPNITQPFSNKIQGESESAPRVYKKKTKNRKTFAPASEIKDIADHLRPGQGSVVEVMVTWKERLLTTYHYSKPGLVRMGSEPNFEINFPEGLSPQGWPLLEVGTETRIAVTSDMKVELITPQGRTNFKELIDSGKALSMSGASTLKLNQGEVYFISFSNSDLQIYVRFVPQPPAVPIPPWMFRSSEVTGIVVSLILLYVYTTSPVTQEAKQKEEIPAHFIFEKPKVKPIVVKIASPVSSEIKPEPIKQIAKVSAPSGKASQSGSFKQTKMLAASARSRDRRKMGILSTLMSGGTSQKINKAYDGAGEIMGAASQATGAAGFNVDSSGNGMGKFKSVGPGAEGTSTVGIAGLGTKNGRGTSYGSENGLGNKTSVAINAGVGEENFVGTIDREAVRRVIRSGLREIRGCYERELNKLNKTQSLEGKVVIEWTIAEGGRALRAKVKNSTLGNASVENCVRDRLASWQFPEPPVGGVAEVNYPFYFRAEN